MPLGAIASNLLDWELRRRAGRLESARAACRAVAGER